jgi:ribosome modulation factor
MAAGQPMSVSVAFEKGWSDERAGKPVPSCPYRPTTPEWSAWQKGWCEARAWDAKGHTHAEKAGLGLAATDTLVGAGPMSPDVHPNWRRYGPVVWSRPGPEAA